MKVSLCDKCREPMDNSSSGNRGRVAVYIALGMTPEVGGKWHEFHRACARNLTIAEIYNQKGIRPL